MNKTSFATGSVPYGCQAPAELSRELNRAYPVETASFDDLLTAIDHSDSEWRATQGSLVSASGLERKMLLPNGS